MTVSEGHGHAKTVGDERCVTVVDEVETVAGMKAAAAVCESITTIAVLRQFLRVLLLLLYPDRYNIHTPRSE